MQSFIRFKDGKYGNFVLYLVEGACLIGEATAYVYRQVGSEMKRVYVVPVEHNKNCFKEV